MKMVKDDAISRQAVLEGIRNLYPDIPIVDIMGARRKWLEKYAPYFECENVVEHLPPVTPYESVTEFADRCKECGAKCGKLLKQKSDNWIPVSERLPEENGRYLTYIENPYYDRLSYIMVCDYIQSTWRPDDETVSNDVMYWMPLPVRPYETESEE